MPPLSDDRDKFFVLLVAGRADDNLRAARGELERRGEREQTDRAPVDHNLGGVPSTVSSPICDRAMVNASVSIFRYVAIDGPSGVCSAVVRCCSASTG